MAIKRIGKGFGFGKVKANYQAFKVKAPKEIANDSLNHYLEGFRKGGGQTDASKSGWQPRGPRKGETGGKPSNLILRGDLRRSIKVLKSTFKQIIIGTNRIPYATRHNEGTTDKKGRKMPQREFIGDSKELNKKNKETLVKLLRKVFK